MEQPWDIFWQAEAYKGKTALLSEPRETIAMALLRKGHLDINTEDPALINQAVADLKELYDICNIKVGDIQYQSVPEGTSWLNQAWSGDMIAGYIYYLPKGTPATAARVLEGRQGQGAGPERLLLASARRRRSRCSRTSSSTTCSTTASPTRTSSTSTATNRPSNEIDPESLVKDGVVPENLANSVLTEGRLRAGLARRR